MIVEKQPRHLAANKLLASILSAAGDDGRALDALLRIMASEHIPDGKLIETIEPFLEKYGDESRLLVPLGGLRGRSGNQKKSLDNLEKALASDNSFARAVLDEMLNIVWSKKYLSRGRLLEADCHIVSNDFDSAFSILEDVDAGTRPARARVMERLSHLIDSGPKKEYYEFASQLLAGGGDTKGAESILREGIDSLGGEAAIGRVNGLVQSEGANGLGGGVHDCLPPG